MKYDKVVAYDLETTGFNPKKDKILEIGAVAYFPITGERRFFSTLININQQIDWRISILTGIANVTLKEEEALPLNEVLKTFIDFCNEDAEKILYVGHNIKAFDNKFMNINLGRHRMAQIKDKDSYDTLVNFRKLKSSKGSKMTRSQKANLHAACKYFRIKLDQPKHRALPDAKNTLALFLKLTACERSKWLKRKQ